MIFKTFVSSPEMAAAKVPRRNAKYPWHTMAIGESFVVPYSEAKLTTLKTACYKMGKKLGKRFMLFDHGEKTGYEIGCLPIVGSSNPVSGSPVAQEPVERTSEAPRASAPWAPFDKE